MEMNKKAIGKEIFITILCIVLGFVAFCLTLFLVLKYACATKEVTLRTNGFFQYIIVGENSRFQDKNNDAVAIVGFTASGFEQETINIPKEIDGHPVQYIGFKDEGFTHYNSHRVECGENIKKIYIYDNIKEIVYFDGSDVALMLCSDRLDIVFGVDVSLKTVYMYSSLYSSGNFLYKSSPANVVFMNNYSNEVNQGYYRLDHIGAGETIPAPPAPMREGYLFEGWYREAECVNAWDFRKSPEIEEGEEFRLYAKWRVA